MSENVTSNLLRAVHWTLGQLSTSNQVQVAIATDECCSKVTLIDTLSQ